MSHGRGTAVPPAANAWTREIPDEQWAVYREAVDAVQADGCRVLLGGAFALATYTGRWRNTKDLDFYVLPAERGPVVRSLMEAGFEDFHRRMPYDRGWIHRLFRDDVIVDVIWSMANRRAAVDEDWFRYARPLVINGRGLASIPAEELLWAKLYVLQRDRCDWPDVLNLMYAVGPELDWNRLIDRMGDDASVLAAALTLFGWLAPERAADLPDLRRRLEFAAPAPPLSDEDGPVRRAALLDTRSWFLPMPRE